MNGVDGNHLNLQMSLQNTWLRGEEVGPQERYRRSLERKSLFIALSPTFGESLKGHVKLCEGLLNQIVSKPSKVVSESTDRG